MGTHITKETFEIIYNNTYNSILKYTICHCKNLDDVNDIIQDIYIELYQTIINKNYIDLENVESYIIGMAKNKIKRHYKPLKVSYSQIDEEELEQFEDDDMNIEMNIITKDNVLQVWNYLKNKNELTARIFYLYYVMEISIKEIAIEMEFTESNIKNHLYRTQKELKEKFKKGDNYNVR